MVAVSDCICEFTVTSEPTHIQHVLCDKRLDLNLHTDQTSGNAFNDRCMQTCFTLSTRDWDHPASGLNKALNSLVNIVLKLQNALWFEK